MKNTPTTKRQELMDTVQQMVDQRFTRDDLHNEYFAGLRIGIQYGYTQALTDIQRMHTLDERDRRIRRDYEMKKLRKITAILILGIIITFEVAILHNIFYV